MCIIHPFTNSAIILWPLLLHCFSLKMQLTGAGNCSRYILHTNSSVRFTPTPSFHRNTSSARLSFRAFDLNLTEGIDSDIFCSNGIFHNSKLSPNCSQSTLWAPSREAWHSSPHVQWHYSRAFCLQYLWIVFAVSGLYCSYRTNDSICAKAIANILCWCTRITFSLPGNRVLIFPLSMFLF